MSDRNDRVVGPLRGLRETLLDSLQQVQTAADSVLTAEPRLALAAIERAHGFVSRTLIPHSRAEEFTLFTAYDGIVGHPGSLEPLMAQHRSLARMADDLAKVLDAVHASGELARYQRYLLPLLHGVYAVARVHLESEDDTMLPLLDEHLSESQVGIMVDTIGRVMRRITDP